MKRRLTVFGKNLLVKLAGLRQKVFLGVLPANRQARLTGAIQQRTYASPVKLLAVTTVSIFLVELAVMGLFHTYQSTWIVEGLLDATLLSLLLSPLLYFFLFRPMIINISERKQAEDALRLARDELEVRVKERTAELAQVNAQLLVVGEELRRQNQALTLSGKTVEKERQRAERLAQILAQERDTLHTIMENTRAHLAYLDPDFNFVQVNSAYAQGSGHLQEELVGHNHFDLFPNPENKVIFERVKLTGQPAQFYAKPFEFADQPERGITYWDWTLVPITGKAEKVQGFVFSLLDVTEQKRAEEALRLALEESRQRQVEISALLAGSQAILQYREFEVAARFIFDICKHLLDAAAGYVALLSKDGTQNEIVLLDSGGMACYLDPTLPMPIRGLREQAYRSGNVVFENNFSASRWAKLLPSGHSDLHNVLFAPLKINDNVVGLLGLANKPGGFTNNDAQMAQAFSELAAIALLNRQTLDALERSEERFRSVAQTASEAIITVDRQGQIVFWNEAAAHIFGYSLAEALGQPLIFIMPPRFHSLHQQGITRLVSAGASHMLGKTVEMTGLTRDGREFPLELSLSTWKSREEIFFTGIIHDITQRKQAEESLRALNDRLEQRVQERTAALAQANQKLQAEITERRQAEQSLHLERNRLKSILDALPDGVYIVNRQYDVEYVNPVNEREFGPVLGRKCFEYLHDRTEVCPWCRNLEVFAGKTVRWEWTSFKTGKTYDLFDTPLINADGTVSKLEIFHDITHRREVEKELRASEERFRQLAENINETFWITELDSGRFSYVSPAYEKMWGRSCQSLYQQPASFLKAVHPEDRERVVAGLERQAQGNYDEEYRIVLPDDTLRWIRTRAFPVYNEQKQAYRIAGISEDVTERVRAYQTLEHRVSERTHELSTLLEVSHSMASILEMEPLLGLILDQLKSVVQYSSAIIFKLEGNELFTLAQRGPDVETESSALRFSVVDMPVYQKVTHRQQPVIILDVHGSSRAARAFQTSVGPHLKTMFRNIHSWLGVPLTIQERVIGMLSLHHHQPHYYTSRHAELAVAFANQAAIAIENARLYKQAHELAAMQERQRLARDLHDSVSQSLFSASLAAEVLPNLWEIDRAEGLRCLVDLHRLARGALAEMRTLLLELRPAALVETTLGELLSQLAEAISVRARLELSVTADPHCLLPPDVQVVLYRIAQEALNNVAKHAHASRVTVNLRCVPDSPANTGKQILGVELSITDNGRGFQANTVPPVCLGLGIMRERAESIGATFALDTQPGHGTRVVVSWPGVQKIPLPIERILL